MPEEKPVAESPVSETPGKIITLPGGYLHKDGKVYRDAEIVPMTGFTRKAISREDVRSNPSKVTDVILTQCLKRVGPATTSNRLLADMLIGDRDFLILEIRRVSMGDTITANIPCDSCKNSIEVKFNLDEIEVVRLKEGEGEIRDGARVFKIENDGMPLKATCRYPKGADQQIMVPLITKNPVEANYKLYAACLLEWNNGTGPFDSAFFERLPVNALDVFEQAFSDAQPGPILRQSVPCPVCGVGIEFTFQGSDFLFRPPKRGKS